ncbi:MAG: tRNA pseudouridine(55) synthase TruB [Calditrichaceae bacterium]|nr:tRNA pseudouridine(55) synthase TruB [Calditrichaceae bacterium]MBN2710380.1 tRNA pseudouridine(55) synthase TruB [Calditrichaceae bacterium]RQV92898.1 MAG: tRNA pseudouridine(55) synthase TruB [Calditrichota bacterium]
MITLLKKNDQIVYDEKKNGWLVLFNKEADWTSFDVVKKVRNIVNIKKVGHAGTLDPFATGLLILGIADGTKSLGRLSGLSKHYSAEIHFGIETDTYDCTGQIVQTRPVKNITLNQIESALVELSGEIWQTPPMFSAKKINGQRLYKLARKNIEVEREPEKITVYSYEIINWKVPVLSVRLHVSKGAYIRAYANDLGRKLECGAHLAKLSRDRIGDFDIMDAFTIGEFKLAWNSIMKSDYGNN